MTRRIARRLCFVLVLAGIVAGPAGGASPRVLAVEFSGVVNPVSKDYLVDQLERAEREDYAAVVLLVDTPGGLDASMREIIKAELAADLPVVFYVHPQGARAASAGVFLAMAADVVAMAPQTNIGSSTPVSLSGEAIPEDARRKLVNDAAAYIRSLAEEHGRNADWAESAVRTGSNLPAREALERNVIDVVATDLPTLLDRIDGKTTVPKGLVLDTAGAQVEHVQMSLWKRILNVIIDPNVIVLLLSLGSLGILIELWNPGLVLPGTVGVISLVLGLYGLQVLPVNWAGIVLMLLALGFFAAEALVAGFGALALAGAVSFFFGALMLFDPAGEAFQVSVPVALAVAGTLALATAIVLTKVVQARRAPAAVGLQKLVGEHGVVRTTGNGTVLVLVNGELWRARTAELLHPGDEVVVDRVEDDLLLDVHTPGRVQRALVGRQPGR